MFSLLESKRYQIKIVKVTANGKDDYRLSGDMFAVTTSDGLSIKYGEEGQDPFIVVETMEDIHLECPYYTIGLQTDECDGWGFNNVTFEEIQDTYCIITCQISDKVVNCLKIELLEFDNNRTREFGNIILNSLADENDNIRSKLILSTQENTRIKQRLESLKDVFNQLIHEADIVKDRLINIFVAEPENNETGDQNNKIVLKENSWYAWHMFPGYGGPYFSPIKICRIKPLKTGKGLVDISFFNAFYASGVQGFVKTLKVIKRSELYMVCTEEGTDMDRTVIITPISVEWLNRIWPLKLPPGMLLGETIDDYLDRVF